MLTIGITGGSGSGKSTVANMFCALGAETIDADVVYHDLLNNSDSMMRKLRKRFPEAIKEDGRLSRKTLAQIVFSDTEALADLNRIAHEFVIKETEHQMSILYERNVQCICLDAIALFESGLDNICDVTVGVIAPRDLRLKRITLRDNIDSMAASARINAQKNDDFYRENCDYIIENDGDMETVSKAAEDVYNLITKGTEV